MRDTSLTAYREMLYSGQLSTSAAKVYDYLKKQSQPKTRQQISKSLGMGINCVCGRVNELVKAGALEEAGLVKCPVTKNSAHTLKVAA